MLPGCLPVTPIKARRHRLATIPSSNPIPQLKFQGALPCVLFSKSTKLENVLYDVRGPVVDEAARMEDEGERILKLNIGNPAPFGFRTPDEVIKDMRQQLPDCEGYSNSRGLFSARKAIMQYSQIKGLPNVQMEHIYTGNGVSGAHSAFDERAARQWRRDSDPQPRLSALDGVRDPCRRSSRALSVR